MIRVFISSVQREFAEEFGGEVNQEKKDEVSQKMSYKTIRSVIYEYQKYYHDPQIM